MPSCSPLRSVEHRVAAGGLLERGQVGRDRHHHPEERRDDGEHAQAEQHPEHAQLADPHARGSGSSCSIETVAGSSGSGSDSGGGAALAGARGARGAARRARLGVEGVVRVGPCRRAVAGRVRRLLGGTAARPRGACAWRGRRPGGCRARIRSCAWRRARLPRREPGPIWECGAAASGRVSKQRGLGPREGETLALGRMEDSNSDAARAAAHLARNAVDCLPAGRARGAPRAGPPAARQARARPDGARHPPRPHRRADEAARVPGRGPHGRADRRRLHRARGRPVRALGDAAGAVGRGDRRATPRPTGARRPRSCARDERLEVRHNAEWLDMPMEDLFRLVRHPDRRAAARARRLRQALGRRRADLAARAALPGAPGLRLGLRARPTSSSAAPTRRSTC